MTNRDTHPVSDEMTVKLGDEFTAPSPTGWTEVDCEIYNRAALKAGLITLTNDPSAEIDFHKMIASFDDIRLSTHRVYSPQYSNMAALLGVKQDIADSAAALMPDDDLDVIAFACTSAAMVVGSDVISEQIQIHKPNCKVTDPMASVLSAFLALNVKRIALLTPYIGEVNVNLAEYLENQGIEIANKGFFRIYDDDQRNRVGEDYYFRAARMLTKGTDCDALFITCTALSTAPIISAIENKIGVPVITSNQAMVWNVMRIGQHAGKSEQFGKLFTV